MIATDIRHSLRACGMANSDADRLIGNQRRITERLVRREELNMNRITSAAGHAATLLCAGLVLTAGARLAHADEILIRMLDSSSAGPLAFEPGFVKAMPGDTLVFEPTQKGGHSTVSVLVPPGGQPWTGAPDKETRVKLDAEGVYLYACAAHKMMGMVGVVLVGSPVNLEEARAVAGRETSKLVLNKDRLEKELAQIK